VQDGAGKPLFIAFDVYENPSQNELMPIPPSFAAAFRHEVADEGLSDLQSNVDSPEASEVKPRSPS